MVPSASTTATARLRRNAPRIAIRPSTPATNGRLSHQSNGSPNGPSSSGGCLSLAANRIRYSKWTHSSPRIQITAAPAPAASWALRDQDQLAADMPLLAETMCFGRLGERERALDRDLEAAGLDQRGRLRQAFERATLGAAGDLDAELGRLEAGDRGDAAGVAGELDQIGEAVAAGGVEREVDAVRRERADALRHAVAVGRRLSAERAQELVVALARGSDHARAARHRELDGDRADAAGGAVDHDRLAGAEAAEHVEDARARLGRHRQSRRLLPGRGRGLGHKSSRIACSAS